MVPSNRQVGDVRSVGPVFFINSIMVACGMPWAIEGSNGGILEVESMCLCTNTQVHSIFCHIFFYLHR